MARIRCWTAFAPLCLLLFATVTTGQRISAGGPAEPPAEEAILSSTPKPPPRPLESEPQRQVVRMELKGQDDSSPKLGYGNCQWLYPREAAPENVLQEPPYQSKNPVYYAARYGNAKDNVFAFVLDESGGPGGGYNVVYVDVNNDNRIDPEKERYEFRLSTRSRDDPLRISLSVTADGVAAPYFVNFTAFPYSDDKYLIEKIHANLRNSSYYQGEAFSLGERRTIAIADLDSNGLFNDVERGLFDGDRFFVDLDGQGQFGGRGERMESFPYGGYVRIAGVWYSIVASPDGSRVGIVRERPALGKIEVPRQIGSARLSSPTQPLDLKFVDGSDDAVAGTYHVQSVGLLADGELADGWTLQGTFAAGEPKLTVTEDETTRLEAGLPLKVESQVVVDEERTLRISLRISGIAGETYRWRPRRGSSSKAGFAILDPSGESVATGQFE